jgi:membrane associated rhomboid family serine protease
VSHYRTEIRFGFAERLTPAVKTLLIINGVLFVLQQLFDPYVVRLFSLSAPLVLPWHFQVWRLGTYMFLHADFWHLFWNMFALFIFGCAIEEVWGSRSFFRYYTLCGLGSALFALIPWDPIWGYPIIGASGAIYGILAAFAVMFPRRQILLFFVLPIEARYLVLFYGLISFASAVSGAQGVAHIVHLGGLVTGFALLRWAGVARPRRAAAGQREFLGSVKNAYRRWRMKRLRKKFESYYEKRSGGDGPGPIIH